MWTDASGKLGLGFAYAGNGFLYQLQQPKPCSPLVDIFFLELLAILSGIHHIAHFAYPPRRLLVFSDSLDSVAVLNSLHAPESLHNSILLAIAEIMMKTGIDLRVHHIKANRTSELICSLLMIDEYRHRYPADRVVDIGLIKLLYQVSHNNLSETSKCTVKFLPRIQLALQTSRKTLSAVLLIMSLRLPSHPGISRNLIGVFTASYSALWNSVSALLYPDSSFISRPFVNHASTRLINLWRCYKWCRLSLCDHHVWRVPANKQVFGHHPWKLPDCAGLLALYTGESNINLTKCAGCGGDRWWRWSNPSRWKFLDDKNDAELG